MRRIFLFIVAVIVAGVILASGVVFYFSKTLPSVDRIASRQIVQSTKIYDRTGKVLLYEISAGERRTVVPLSEISQFLRDATIAIEDENFYTGSGVDWKAIVRALIANLEHGEIVQGGSTITQQLARNAFLSLEQTFSRKIREAILATQLNRRYSKDQILEFYLNEIPYGPTAYGVEAASQTYFGKPIQEISLAEAAILAALPRAPSYYSPWGSHVKDLVNRQRLVLKKLLDTGKIDEKQYDLALKTEVVFQPRGQGLLAPHFVMAVQDQLVQKYGEDLVRTGGLKVITTLDYDLQQAAEKAVKEGAERNEKLYGGTNAALVAEDPKTGQVLALVGSRDYFDQEREGNFNVATQGLRQPGSALKPFVYLEALEKGYTPETVLFDVPTEFVPNNLKCPIQVDFTNDDTVCYHPQNFDNQFRGPVTFRQALGQSINVPAVKALYLAGLKDTLGLVNRFGITTLNDIARYGLSLVLGGGEVRLVDLVGAYSVLAQDGVRHGQSFVLEVRDARGNVLEAYQDKIEKEIEPDSVRSINDVLSDTNVRAGLFQGSLSLTTFPNYDIALKTGTSNDYRDAWTVGYMPSLVAGVWAGNNDNSPMHRQGSSILAAVPIWNAFMIEALKHYSPEAFPRPEPRLVEKPVLKGDYLAGNQVHSILFYVDKNNPLGGYPSDPTRDPQFVNWEFPVIDWARKNITDFDRLYNQAGAAPPAIGVGSSAPGPQVAIDAPRAGAFIQGSLNLLANISSNSSLARIRVSFNGKNIKEFTGALGGSYRLDWAFVPENPAPQNLLKIEATDEWNRTGSADVIVYK